MEHALPLQATCKPLAGHLRAGCRQTSKHARGALLLAACKQYFLQTAGGDLLASRGIMWASTLALARTQPRLNL
eukprot:10978318-Alexandrium_andersonii.AAC.1